MVLRPNRRAAACSLALDYTTPLDQKLPALLVIEFANPRILALFRYCKACDPHLKSFCLGGVSSCRK